MRKTITIILAVLISLMVLGVTRASPEQWTEVTRFTGSAGQDTAYFTCDHAEWRINWSYISTLGYEQYSMIGVGVRDRNGNAIAAMSGINPAYSGLSYIHNNQGTFYLSITALYVASYTIIIEQDLDSIPEYPVGLLFAMLTIAILSATAIKHRARFKVI